MGSEDLFHKRKARQSADLQRQKQARTQNKRYLVVCEGTKTEPLYFRDLLSDLRIRPQVVRIAPNNGASPDRVVAHACDLYEEDAATGDPYDKVYCVFDRDAHPTFAASVQKIKDISANGKPFVAITSTPCFEIWLLLHFVYSNQPYHSIQGKSVGDQLISVLKKFPVFAKYAKGQQGIYFQVKNNLAQALTNAERLRIHGDATGTENPSTNVDELVIAIKALVK